jgi:glycosyltransferase involved in cell wall biosynthesis
MKIVFATDNYWPRVSGLGVSIDTFATELAAMGHEVHLLAPAYPGDERPDARRLPFTVHRFATMGVFISKEDRLMRASEERTVFALLDRLRPDVVHTHTEVRVGRAAWRWARKHDVPLVMTSHTHWEQYAANYLPMPGVAGRALVRFLMRRVYRLADAVVTPSEHMRQVLLGYGLGPDIEVLPTGVQRGLFDGPDKGDGAPLLERYPELAGRQVLLSVGRVAEEKNPGLLLEAVTRLAPSHPRLTWLVVGDGPSRDALKEAIRRRGLDTHVVFTGYLDRAMVAHAFALADVFAMASRTETQGLVTIEALASGVPVVAVDAMGSHDVLEGERGGFLVPNDPQAFAARVEALLGDALLHKRKSNEALAAAQRFSPRVLAERLLGVYARVGAADAQKRPVAIAR